MNNITQAKIACLFTFLAFISFGNNAFAQNADLSVHLNGPPSVTPGATISYKLFISNNGPNNSSNVIVQSPVVPNLTVTSVGGCVAGSGSGGSASCPIILTVAALQGSGLVVPSLLSGSTITLTVSEELLG